MIVKIISVHSENAECQKIVLKGLNLNNRG